MTTRTVRTLGFLILSVLLLVGGGLVLVLLRDWGLPAGAAARYARDTRFWVFVPFVAFVGALLYAFIAQSIARHPVARRAVLAWSAGGALAALPFSFAAYLDNGHRATEVLALAHEPGVQIQMGNGAITLRRAAVRGVVSIDGQSIPTTEPTFSLLLSPDQFRAIVASARTP